MQNFESTLGLPILGKNVQIGPSIAPFKSSVAKNPSYFSLNRSQYNLIEKAKLKEEN